MSASPAWSVVAVRPAPRSAGCVQAGDVNGDGDDDVIVGAYRHDNGQTDEGRADLYLGSATGLASAPAWTTESDQASTDYGYGARTAGDLNGDGYADVVVAAPGFDNGQTDEGKAWVYLARPVASIARLPGAPKATGSAPVWGVRRFSRRRG